MGEELRFLWNATRGNRLRPWRSPYLRWRLETYADQKRAMELYPQLKPDVTLLDVAAAYGEAKKTGKGIGVIGYCYGGLVTWLAATRGENLKMQPSCCACYYPGGIGSVAKEEPSCPVMLHFGAQDDHIGKDQI